MGQRYWEESKADSLTSRHIRGGVCGADETELLIRVLSFGPTVTAANAGAIHMVLPSNNYNTLNAGFTNPLQSGMLSGIMSEKEGYCTRKM